MSSLPGSRSHSQSQASDSPCQAWVPSYSGDLTTLCATTPLRVVRKNMCVSAVWKDRKVLYQCVWLLFLQSFSNVNAWTDVMIYLGCFPFGFLPGQEACCSSLPGGQRWAWDLQSALPAVSSTVFLLNQCPPPQRCQWKRPRVSGTPSQAHQGLPGGSVVKNPSANAGDTRDVGSIPGLGRSPGVGNGNLLQYFGGFPNPVAQRLKRLPAMRETWVQSLGWEDPLEKEMATHSSILPGESHGQRSLVGPRCRTESDTTERLYFHFQYSCLDYTMDRGAWWTWGCKESDMTEWLSTYTCTQAHRDPFLLLPIHLHGPQPCCLEQPTPWVCCDVSLPLSASHPPHTHCL